jgi:RNA polymerase sigma-70 factor (ECF subfamily)
MVRDEELVRKLAAGVEPALQELLQRWDRPLAAFIARHTGGADVEDLRQETWMRVVRAADRFQPGKKFSTWLFAIALNLCRDWHRRRPATPLAPETVVRALGGGSDQRDEADQQRQAQLLLAELPEGLRSAVVLRYYHDMSEEQMAEVLDIPRGTVKSRLHQAVRKLMALAGVAAPTDGLATRGGQRA